MIYNKSKLVISLYHGTSTIFLDSIVENGLGGINPIKEWKVYELSRDVYTLSKKYLSNTNLYQKNSYSFKKMIEQKSDGNFNFMHGNTYVTPSKKTAINYAISNKYGSEILSYTIEFFLKILDLDRKNLTTYLFSKYPEINNWIAFNPSPILIEIKNIDTKYLLNEHGKNPKESIKFIIKTIVDMPNSYESILQQTNFRLNSIIDKGSLIFWEIKLHKLKFSNPSYTLYELNL